MSKNALTFLTTGDGHHTASGGKEYARHPTTRIRLIGFLPLIFWMAHASFYWRNGGLPHLLWMCNIGNLMLALGLLSGEPFLIRLAVPWLIIGLPLWILFVVMQGGWLLTSFFAHVGGSIVGIVALSKIRADQVTWVYAFGWYVVVQQVCRIFTPPELNVNIAHRIWNGWETVFGSYWQFWLLTTLLIGVGLWVLGIVLLKLFPPRPLVT